MEETNNKIMDVIDSIRPFIQSDGGDIEFVKYEDNYVYIRLSGACVGCEFIDYTLEDTLYEAVKEELPECKGVLNIDI